MQPCDARESLLRLLRERAVLRGDFVLASGAHSTYYLDARIVALSFAGAPLVGQVFFDMLRNRSIDAVAGLAIGADPIVCAIAAYSGLNGTGIDGLIVRKEAKPHGTGQRIEGPWRTGLRVAVVDDTLTSGASALEAAKTIQEAGGAVDGVYALIDREQGARTAIENAGLSYQAVFTARQVLQE